MNLPLLRKIEVALGLSLERFFLFTFSLAFILGFFYPISFLLLFLIYKRHRKLFFLVWIGFFCGLSLHYFEKENHPVGKGQGIFIVDSYRSTFFKSLICLGHMEQFTFENGEKIKNLSLAVRLKGNQRLKGNYSYQIEGEIQKKGNFLEIKPSHKVKPYQKKLSLVEWRYQIKKKLLNLWKTHFSENKEIVHLFQALSSGELEDPLLFFLFQKTGVCHVLAISGFHFSFLLQIAMLLIQPFIFHRKIFWTSLMLLSSCYFLFLGVTPSIFRAYLMGLFFFLAHLFSRPYSSLNALGFSFLISFIFFPTWRENLGFQLSFLSTLAILLSYRTLQKAFAQIFPIRSKNALEEYSFFSKITYRLLHGLLPILSITLGVNLFLFPYLLYLFHSFPLLGLVYNLFIPIFIEAILLFSLVFLMIHFLCPFLHVVLDPILRFLGNITLNTLYNTPAHLDIKILCTSFSFSWVLIYWIFLILVFLYFRKDRVEKILV